MGASFLIQIRNFSRHIYYITKNLRKNISVLYKHPAAWLKMKIVNNFELLSGEEGKIGAKKGKKRGELMAAGTKPLPPRGSQGVRRGQK